jgi:hypothetical protein
LRWYRRFLCILRLLTRHGGAGGHRALRPRPRRTAQGRGLSSQPFRCRRRREPSCHGKRCPNGQEVVLASADDECGAPGAQFVLYRARIPAIHRRCEKTVKKLRYGACHVRTRCYNPAHFRGTKTAPPAKSGGSSRT